MKNDWNSIFNPLGAPLIIQLSCYTLGLSLWLWIALLTSTFSTAEIPTDEWTACIDGFMAHKFNSSKAICQVKNFKCCLFHRYKTQYILFRLRESVRSRIYALHNRLQSGMGSLHLTCQHCYQLIQTLCVLQNLAPYTIGTKGDFNNTWTDTAS